METKTIIITGANSGLGFACAKNIARASAEYRIILACRDLEKAEQAKSDLIKDTGNQNIICMELNLSSLKSVREFVKSIISARFAPLYGIVCNAGVSGMNKGITEDGFELTFGVNHLAHFLLTNLLIPHISEQGRIAVVSSDMHNPPRGLTWPGVKLLLYPSGDFDENRYCLSKLCNLYFTYELARELERTERKITVNGFNPGFMINTNLFPDKRMFTDSFVQSVSDRVGSLEHSGKKLADLITSPRYEQVTARYIDRGNDTTSSLLSYNLENARELWEASMEFVQLKGNWVGLFRLCSIFSRKKTGSNRR